MHATSTTPAPAAAHAHGDATALRSLAIDTLCDLMRRGQASDSRRQAATTALRYLSQLDRLAVTAARNTAAQPTPTPQSQPAHPLQPVPATATAAAVAAPAAQSPTASASSAAPRIEPAAASPGPIQALPASSPAALAPTDPASFPTAGELQSLMHAVRQTAHATPSHQPDTIVSYAPSPEQLAALCGVPAGADPTSRFAAPPPDAPPATFARLLAAASQRVPPSRPASLLAAAGSPGPAP